jgi:gas vesicle protein
VNAKKTYFLLLGLLLASIVGAIAAIFIGNMIMQKSSDNLVKAKLDSIGADTEEQTYLQARKNLERYSTLNETISQVLPKSKDQAQAVKALYQIGDETGIIVSNIQFPTSTLGQKSTAVGSVTQAKAVTGMPGVQGIDISIELLPASGKSISYANMIKFLQDVELNRRNMQIKQISVNADVTNSGVTFKLTLTIFVKP